MRIFKVKTFAEATLVTTQLAKKTELEQKQTYVFCEDKNTLSIELSLASEMGGSFFVDVLNFTRYIKRHNKDVQTLSKTASALLVLKVMNEKKDEIFRFSTNYKPTLSLAIYELIAQLKSAKVKPNDLLNICEAEGGAFQSKLRDIYTIYSAYDNILREKKYTDNNDFFDLMPKLVLQDEKLKGAHVILSGYNSVTKQSLQIVKALNSVATVDFVVVCGDYPLYTNEMLEKLNEEFSADKNNFSICENKYDYSIETLLLQQYMFSTKAYSINNKNNHTENIKIIENSSPYQEAEKVAKRIRYEVIENNLRYKDFVIASSNIEAVKHIYKKVFNEYEIPLYIDEEHTLDTHPLICLSLLIFEAVRLNRTVDSYLRIAKSQILFSNEERTAFTNYVYNNAISRGTLKKEFNLNSDEDRLAESVRLKINRLLDYFKLKASVSDFKLMLLDSFKELDVQNGILNYTEKLRSINETLLAEYTERGAKEFYNALNEIVSLLNDKFVSVKDFSNILLSSATATKIPMIPQYLDNVFMGDFKSAGRRFCKVIFATGLDSSVPFSKQDCALLTDKELYKMDGYRVAVEPKIAIVNKRERENVATALMCFSNKLYLSFSLTDSSGAKRIKGDVIDCITSIFDLPIMNSDEAIGSGAMSRESEVYNYLASNSGMKNALKQAELYCNYSADDSNVISAFVKADKEKNQSLSQNYVDDNLFSLEEPTYNVSNCLNSTAGISATLAEDYFSCPYFCFAKNILGLREKENGETKGFESGSILHGLFEKYIKNIDSIKTKKDSDILAEKLFDEEIAKPEYTKFLGKPKYAYLFNLVKDEAIKRCSIIYEGFNTSSFKPIYEEAYFGDKQKAVFPSIEIVIDGKVRKISGYIDRIDKYTSKANEDYLRIIDYKTGSADDKASDNSFYSGKNLQLYLYANAIKNSGKLAGAYYYQVKDEFKEDNDKNRNYYGKTLLDNEVLEATSSTIYKNELKIPEFGMNFKYAGEKIIPNTNKSTATLSRDELDCYIDYATKITASGIEEFINGNIIPSPSGSDYMNSCDYCKFGSLCGYNSETDNRSRELQGNKESIINAVNNSTQMNNNNSTNNVKNNLSSGKSGCDKDEALIVGEDND